MTRGAGVTPNALYTYFSDMGDLRNRLGDDFLATLDLPLLRGGGPEGALRAFLLHALEVFSASPGHVQLLASQRIVGPHSLALNEALLDFFIADVGHSPERAASITLLLTEWVHGQALLSSADALTTPTHPAWAGIDLGDYPRTAAMLTTEADSSALEILVRAVTST